MSGKTAFERAVDDHRATWGEPAIIARAPGRVNLIGEHTDYNDGFVMPMALPFDTVVVLSPAPTDAVWGEVQSQGFGTAVVDPHDSATSFSADDWAVHIRGVDHLLRQHGVAVRPWRASIASDVPPGASLSSSASLEVAFAHALLGLAEIDWSPTRVAQLGQQVENDIVGLPSGIMDQLISASAVVDHASLIDCRSLRWQAYPLPSNTVIAVMDTRSRRKLVESEFAARRDTCFRVAQALDVASLRDADLDMLKRLGNDELGRRRARHVITENSRTLAAARALEAGDAARVGQLMNESHTSLRDDYEVSGPALDAIVSIARDAPGCVGSRMTGGGFAGCAVALVDSAHADDFRSAVASQFETAHDVEPAIWICSPSPGASVERG